MKSAELLAVVEVPYEQRVVCQAAGCGHSVYRRIHVVRQDGELLVLGSDCYSKLFGGGPPRTPTYGSATGRKLTNEERRMLMENTAELIERFRLEQVQELEARPKAPLVRPQTKPVPARRKIGPSPEEIRQYEAQAKRDVRAKYGVDADLPGWRGLVLQRIAELSAKGGS